MKQNSDIFWAISSSGRIPLFASTMYGSKREVYPIRGNVTITRDGVILAKREKGTWRQINVA